MSGMDEEMYRSFITEQLLGESTMLSYLNKCDNPKRVARRKVVRDVYGSQQQLWELRDAINQLNGIKLDVFGQEVDDD